MDRIAIISGASSGLGCEISLELSKEGLIRIMQKKSFDKIYIKDNNE